VGRLRDGGLPTTPLIRVIADDVRSGWCGREQLCGWGACFVDARGLSGRVARERARRPVTFLCATASNVDFNGERLGDSGLEIAFSDAKRIPALLEAGADADLVVVGSRGIRGLRARQRQRTLCPRCAVQC